MYIVKFWEFFVCEGQQFSPCSLSEIQRNSCWYVVPVSLWKLYRDFLCPISLSMYCRIWIQVTLASRCAFFSTERVSARETNYWVDQTTVLAFFISSFWQVGTIIEITFALKKCHSTNQNENFLSPVRNIYEYRYTVCMDTFIFQKHLLEFSFLRDFYSIFSCSIHV